MAKTELFKKIIIEAFYFLKAYIMNYLFPIVKEVTLSTKEKFLQNIIEIKKYFIETLQSELRKEVQKHLSSAIQEANAYFLSANYELREKIIIDYIFDNIELPFLLRPSKIIAKHILKKKIRELISDKLQDLQKLNQII